ARSCLSGVIEILEPGRRRGEFDPSVRCPDSLGKRFCRAPTNATIITIKSDDNPRYGLTYVEPAHMSGAKRCDTRQIEDCRSAEGCLDSLSDNDGVRELRQHCSAAADGPHDFFRRRTRRFPAVFVQPAPVHGDNLIELIEPCY